MNSAVLQLVSQYPKLATLAPLAGLKANQLTVEHLKLVSGAFDANIPFSEEVLGAFVALLKGKSVNDVSDLIQSPEAIQEIITFLAGGWKGVAALRTESGDETPTDDLPFQGIQ